MKLLYEGIHRRLGFLIQCSGGYDKEYHISKLAEELNINRGVVINLFTESLQCNLLHYIDLLKTGVPIDKVFEFVDEDNKKSLAYARTSLEMMSVFRSPYIKIK